MDADPFVAATLADAIFKVVIVGISKIHGLQRASFLQGLPRKYII